MPHSLFKCFSAQLASVEPFTGKLLFNNHLQTSSFHCFRLLSHSALVAVHNAMP